MLRIFEDKHSSSKDRTFIFINPIFSDGRGDLSHCTGLYKNIKGDPNSKNIKIILVFYSYDPSFEKKIIETMLNMGVPNSLYFSGSRSDFESAGKNLNNDKNLLKYISEAEKIFVISHTGFDGLSNLINHNNTAPVIFVGEHERKDNALLRRTCPERLKIFSMGLSKNTHGIKLEMASPLSPVNAFAVIERNNKIFTDRLLQETQSKNFSDFSENNFFIPAYFTKVDDFLRFILFLAINESLPRDKGFAISYSSGVTETEIVIDAFKAIAHQNTSVGYLLAKTDVNRIELLLQDQEPLIVRINDSSEKVIRIFYKFQLNDESFNAQNACGVLIAGVSGDNTLETSIPYTLPYYISTNARMKKPTIDALHKIISTLPVNLFGSEEVKNSFLLLFDSNNFYQFADSNNNDSLIDMIDVYKDLDLEKMQLCWPSIASHIISYHNFHDKFKKFVIDATPINENISTSDVSKTNMRFI